MADQIDDATREKLKSALWYSIGKIADEESLRLNASATPQFIGTLTEMVWTQIENIAIDLQTFAAHAHRTTIQAEDVLLITRRNEVLEEIMREFIDERRAENAVALDDDEEDGSRRARVKSSKVGKSGRGDGGVEKGSGNGKGMGRVEKGKGKGKGRKGSL